MHDALADNGAFRARTRDETPTLGFVFSVLCFVSYLLCFVLCDFVLSFLFIFY